MLQRLIHRFHTGRLPVGGSLLHRENYANVHPNDLQASLFASHATLSRLLSRRQWLYLFCRGSSLRKRQTGKRAGFAACRSPRGGALAGGALCRKIWRAKLALVGSRAYLNAHAPDRARRSRQHLGWQIALGRRDPDLLAGTDKAAAAFILAGSRWVAISLPDFCHHHIAPKNPWGETTWLQVQ